MKYLFADHQQKGAAYIRALDTVYERVRNGVANFAFSHSDILRQRPFLETAQQNGARKFFIYPHAARPNLVNDIIPPWKYTTAHFVPTRAQRNIMLAYGYRKPVIDVGWSLCKLQPFQERPYLNNVLFAPIHHRCAEIDKLANQEAFQRLAALAVAGEIHLTVRHYKEISTTGIKPITHERIHYVEAGLVPETRDIDRADVVVGHQTFLYLAVARGVPAVGFGTWVPSHIIPGDKVLYAPNWNNYVADLAFPLDVAFGDTLDILWTALEGDERVDRWRTRMIGRPFDDDRFLEAMEEFLR